MADVVGIAHFDIDKIFSSRFNEKKYPFSLELKNISKIDKAGNLTIISIKSNSKIAKEILKKLPRLKAIITRTVGVNHIDLKLCKKTGIAVYHVPDYGAFAIAEHVFAMLLSQTRKIITLGKETKAGRFSWKNGQGFTLKGKTLGVIGVGKTGKEVIKIAKGFQMKLIGFDKVKDNIFAHQNNFKYVPLNELLSKADIISINIPLIKDTRHLINKHKIKIMKNKAILINVSRGEIINTKDLADNLDKFKYVCLDVLEEENLYNLKDPTIKKLATCNKVLITPHIAFFTDLTTTEIVKITHQNIRNFLKNSKENRVI